MLGDGAPSAGPARPSSPRCGRGRGGRPRSAASPSRTSSTSGSTGPRRGAASTSSETSAGGEHVVLPQRGREERGQHGLAGAVAHDVVVEGPLVLGALARRPNARSRNCRPSTVNVPRSPSSESHSRGFSADAERWCSSVSAGPCSPTIFAWRRWAASPPRSSAAGTCLASDSTSPRMSSKRVVQRERHAHAGVLHRHRRERAQVRVVAVGEDSLITSWATTGSPSGT